MEIMLKAGISDGSTSTVNVKTDIRGKIWFEIAHFTLLCTSSCEVVECLSGSTFHGYIMWGPAAKTALQSLTAHSTYTLRLEVGNE